MKSNTDQPAINSHLTGTSRDSEYDALLALLRTQPRVAAPTDFDFKLRARIARAESEQNSRQAGWLAAFWAKSFRPSQAMGALAAIALCVAASLTLLNRVPESTPRSDDNRVAFVTPGQPSANPSAPTIPAVVDSSTTPANALPSAHAITKSSPVRATVVSFKPKAASAMLAQRNDVALADTASSIYLRDKGQMGRISTRPVSIGAEDAALAKPQTVALSF